MLLPVFVATFAGLALALFVLWAAAAERKPLSPRERFIRERLASPEDSPPRWRLAARAGGLVDNPPVRFRPRKTLGFTGCSP